jgi:ferredoxin/flavodoxin
LKDIIIVYFSGKGNTRYITEAISDSFKKRGYVVSLISAEDKQKLSELNYENKLVGIGFPCYALDYPEIIADVIRKLPSCSNPVPAFVFATKGWCAGNSMKKLAKHMRENNLLTIKTGSFICPNNGWITLFSPEFFLCRNMRFDNALSKKIDQYTDDVINFHTAYNQKQFCINTLGNPFIACFGWLLKKMEGLVMKNYRVEYEKCIGCGQCIRNCPDQNIGFDKDKRVVFIHPDKCVRCLRCISDCPRNAIRLGRLITGKGWYTKELRNKYIKNNDTHSHEAEYDSTLQ